MLVLIASITTGALLSTIFGAIWSSMDRGAGMNALIGMLGGGALGALVLMSPMTDILMRANENEIFVVFVILGALGGAIASFLLSRAITLIAN